MIMEVFVSDIVIQEASRGDDAQAEHRLKMLRAFRVLEIDDEIKELAHRFLQAGIIPGKCPEDALHIAVAAANGIDVIVTWNFKHINNPFVRKSIRRIVESNDWMCPEICSPEEFLGDEI
uniref:PIN domain-containing protein n=1 Tax=Candidatus Kentrum sp. SD TaxID=2126332 RepID=A0A450YI44_9GAMM|nr:MAG: PIN domain-containing protein [Candidatus Kentron sp. SD]VFK41206.1 MAG: PIN domain-containing protein [Candidatus Kentron sp. SD]VFK78300.1 MAG: PIN domain-containing protein [Candidatus Kentron sp. SD]